METALATSRGNSSNGAYRTRGENQDHQANNLELCRQGLPSYEIRKQSSDPGKKQTGILCNSGYFRERLGAVLQLYDPLGRSGISQIS